MHSSANHALDRAAKMQTAEQSSFSRSKDNGPSIFTRFDRRLFERTLKADLMIL